MSKDDEDDYHLKDKQGDTTGVILSVGVLPDKLIPPFNQRQVLRLNYQNLSNLNQFDENYQLFHIMNLNRKRIQHENSKK